MFYALKNPQVGGYWMSRRVQWRKRTQSHNIPDGRWQHSHGRVGPKTIDDRGECRLADSDWYWRSGLREDSRHGAAPKLGCQLFLHAILEEDVMAENYVDAEKVPGVREIRVFLCYRRQDGYWHADWLYRQLNNSSFTDAGGNARRIRIYYDKTAPGVSDWKQLHFPSLQTSQALILVCTPGIAVDFSKRGQPDWVYEELRWWCGHRNIAPIVVDSTSEGDRWLPRLITHKWPDINRIDLSKDDAEAAERTDRDFAERIRERITGSIRESEQRTVFEDLQRFKQLTRRLSAALSCAVFLLFLAVSTTILALKAREAEKEQRREAEQQQKLAERQTKIAEQQKRIVQEQVVKLLFLPSTKDSDEARDAFITSLNWTTSTWVLLLLLERTVNYKSNYHGVINALRILECYGPYNKDPLIRRSLEKFYVDLASVEDEEVKRHLEMLKTATDADLSNRPRPKISGYDRCQWARDAATRGLSKSINDK